MLKRTVLSAFCAAAMLVTGVANAQDSATLTLRSGEKVSGQLVDLGGVGYTIRVSGAERQIAQNDVAVIDFTGAAMTDADWARFSGPSVVVLRNGQTVNGSLYDIGGTSPLKLTIRTGDGDREMSSTEVARIIVAKPDNVVGTSGSTTPPVVTTPVIPGAINVAASQQWTNTGVTVRKGQRLTFSTTGEIQLSDDVNDVANADGSKNARYAAGSPIGSVLAGALIGRIGNGQAFAIGNQTSIVAPASGILRLGINDNMFADNKGAFQVVIR